MADITVFSFHAVKNLTTAEGGAICITMPAPFNNAEIYKTLTFMEFKRANKRCFHKSQAGGWRYDIVYPGFKINMPDVCAAIGLAQIRKYDTAMLSERKRVFEFFRKAVFKRMPGRTAILIKQRQSACSYHLYPLG